MRWLLETAMRETWQVGRKRGIALADELVAKTLAAVDGLPHEMKASMLGDLEAGGRLEVPWLSGAVVRMAREAGLEAPVNRAVLAALKPFIDGTAHQAS
jgi:2-dehydropantoate 2-reductase